MPDSVPPTPGVQFVLDYPSQNLRAEAVLQDGEFVVLAGSQARSAWEGKEKATSSYASLHADLKRSGVLTTEDNHCVFAKNYAFSSPSAAAAVVYGRHASGTTAWKTSIGQTYKDWEAAQLAD